MDKHCGQFNILVLGPDRRNGGGIATVIGHLFSGKMAKSLRLIYLPTQVNKGRWKKFFHVIYASYLFWKINLTERIDLIHIHSASGNSYFRKSLFLLYSKILRKRVVFHIHGGGFYDFYTDQCPRLVKWYVRKTLGLARIVVVLSHQWRNKFSAIIDPEKIRVIPNPVHITWDNFRSTKDASQKKILFMGKLVQKKGVYDLITVAERLVNKFKDLKFILAGGGETEKIKEILEAKGLTKYFELPGWIKNKDDYYREADVFILPSYVEALPMVILEAASYGLPIVATTVGAIPEFIESEKSGFLLEPGSIDGFTRKLEILLENEDMREEFGLRARERIASYCAKEKVLRQFEQLYLSLVRVSP